MRVARACFALGLLVLLLCTVQASVARSPRDRCRQPRADRCAGRRAHADRLHRRSRRHHPSDRHLLHPPGDCRGRCREGRSPRHRAPHAGRPRRLDARHQHRHHRVEDAGRRLRVAAGKPRRVGRIPHHHRRRRRGDGARDAHRRRASSVGRRPEGRRHDGQEDDVRRGGICADDRRAAQAKRRARRAGRHREPDLHRAGSGRGQSAAHRRHRRRSARSAEEARWPDHPPLRWPQSDAAHARRGRNAASR